MNDIEGPVIARTDQNIYFWCRAQNRKIWNTIPTKSYNTSVKNINNFRYNNSTCVWSNALLTLIRLTLQFLSSLLVLFWYTLVWNSKLSNYSILLDLPIHKRVITVAQIILPQYFFISLYFKKLNKTEKFAGLTISQSIS